MASWALNLSNYLPQSLLARGRGIVRLIEGLGEGDPVSWGIVGVIVLFFVGKFVYSSMQNKDKDSSSSDQSE